MNYYDLVQERVKNRAGSDFFGLSASTDMGGDEALLKQSIGGDKSRQDMSVGSSMFAMACPLNPFAMFLGMLFMNHFENKYRSDHLSAHEEMLARRIDMAGALAAVQARRGIMDIKNKKEPSPIQTIDSWLSKREEKRPPTAEEKQKEIDRKKQIQALEAEKRGSITTAPQSHTNVSKLLKAKSQLESQKYQLSQNQDYAGNASVAARIDVLDVILKRLDA